MAHVMCGVDGEAAALLTEVSPYPLPLAPACSLDITPSCVASVEQPELKKHRQRRGSGKPREPGALTALPIDSSSAAIWFKKRNKPLSITMVCGPPKLKLTHQDFIV